jgi:hypothetical protein
MTKIDSVVCHIARNLFFWLDNAKLTMMGQARSLMTNFWIDFYFNSYCRNRKNLVLTLRYAKKLCAMWHGAKSRLSSMLIAQSCDSALCHLVWNSSQKFSCQLRAMPQSAELQLHALLHSGESTYVCKFTYEFSTICKNILTRSSVTQVGLTNEKIWRSKILWDCSFKPLKDEAYI